MSKKALDVAAVHEFRTIPRAAEVIKMFDSVLKFSGLKFAMVKESRQGSAAVEPKLIMSKDCFQRPKLLKSLCKLIDVMAEDARGKQTFASVCSKIGDASYWQVSVKRANPAANKDTWPTLENYSQNIFLVGESREAEYSKSRNFFTQRESGRELVIRDGLMSLTHVRANSAWGVVPTWGKVKGELLYEGTDDKDNYIVSIAAPNVGIVKPDVLATLTSCGFKVGSGCELAKRIVPKPDQPGCQFSKTDLIKMACAKFMAFEADERPGREERERQRKEAQAVREKKRKDGQYCSNCQCEGCKKKQRTA